MIFDATGRMGFFRSFNTKDGPALTVIITADAPDGHSEREWEEYFLRGEKYSSIYNQLMQMKLDSPVRYRVDIRGNFKSLLEISPAK